jgi:uncharacterized membrane protein
MPIRFAVATGNFNNPAIWDNGVVPTSADDLYANNFIVTINGTYTVQTIRNTASPISIPDIATPAMTSNSTPSGIVFASSHTALNVPWNAFAQDSNTTFWQSGTANAGTLGYQFSTGKVIKRYILRMISSTTLSFPTAWTFQGSNDGTTYTTLDTVTGAVIPLGSNYVSSVLANTTSYTYYRINITAVVSAGTAPSIGEFELTESTGSVYGGTAGGQFRYANGGDLTCTSSPAIVVGIASVPVLEMTLASPNTGTFTGNILTLANTGNFFAIRHSSTGILNLNGNYSIDGTTGRSMISVTLTGTLNIVGNLSSTNNAGNNINTLVMNTGGTINITGNCTGSTNVATSSSPVFASSGNINITGNTTGVTGPAVALFGAVNYTQIGNVNGSTAQAAIFNLTSAATISVTGIITAGTGAPAIYSSFALTSGYGSGTFVKVSGNVVNTNNIMAIVAPRVTIDTNTASWLFQISTGGNRTLYAAGVALGNPAITDVRLGTVYGASSELTGTLAMPIPATVLLGVLTDATTGTLLMTPADFWNYLISSGFTVDSIGDRLQNAATVSTTGGQIASYNI